jgi:hypothetical protein
MTLRSTYEWLDDPAASPQDLRGITNRLDDDDDLPEWFSRDPVLHPGLVHAARPAPVAPQSVVDTYNDEVLDTMEEPLFEPEEVEELEVVSARTVPVPKPRPVAPHRRGADPQMDLLRDQARSRPVVSEVPAVELNHLRIDERVVMAVGIGLVASMMSLLLILFVGRP